MRTWIQVVLVLALAVYGITVPAGAMACCRVAPAHTAAAMHDMAMASMHMRAAPTVRHTAVYGMDMRLACEHPACMSAVEPVPRLQVATSQGLEIHMASPMQTFVAVPPQQSTSDMHLRLPVRDAAFGGAPLLLRI